MFHAKQFQMNAKRLKRMNATVRFPIDFPNKMQHFYSNNLLISSRFSGPSEQIKQLNISTTQKMKTELNEPKTN